MMTPTNATPESLIAALVPFRLIEGRVVSVGGEEPPRVTQPPDTATPAPAATALISSTMALTAARPSSMSAPRTAAGPRRTRPARTGRRWRCAHVRRRHGH